MGKRKDKGEVERSRADSGADSGAGIRPCMAGLSTGDRGQPQPQPQPGWGYSLKAALGRCEKHRAKWGVNRAWGGSEGLTTVITMLLFFCFITFVVIIIVVVVVKNLRPVSYTSE